MSFVTAVKKTSHPYKPHPYQEEGMHWLLKNPDSGLFLPPGLGKTAIVLQAFKHLKTHEAATKMLIIAPIRVAHLVWPAEIKKWSGFNDLTITVLHGSKKIQALQEDSDIYVINPEGLKWFQRYLTALVTDEHKWILIIDESSNFKNGRSQRFKMLKKYLHMFVRRVILTATPAPNGLINLWSQIFLLDQGARLGKFITSFRNRYFYPAGYMGYEYRLQDGAEDRIYDSINDIVMHKGREEIDMPELLTNEISVELPTEARYAYEEMKRDFVASHNGEIIAAPTASTMGNKLRQMSAGAVYTDLDGSWSYMHDCKIDAVKELSDSLDGRPLMIFYEYRHDLMRLQKVFPNSRYLGGGIKAKEADAIVKLWNASEIPQLLLHPASAGHGLNLQAGKCSDVCWFTITWDQELHEQAIGRVWRQGQTNGITSHYIIANDTIDRHVMRVLEGKDSLQSALLNALKK